MKKKWIAAVLSLVLLAGVMNRTADYIQAGQMQQEIAEKILRFHVLANSDSKEDQALKLKVRDAVGSLMSSVLKDADDITQCKQLTAAHMKEIVNTAKEVIESNGYDYAVEASIREVDFPDKTYGAYTFPAGTYEALELIIGAGAGHNWWCVMYPNMCFSGSVYEVVDEDAKESLEHTLTQEEYKSLLEDKDYKIQCKYLKFLNKYLD